MRRGIGIVALVAAVLIFWSPGLALADSISQFSSSSSIQTFEPFPGHSNFDSFGPGNPCPGLHGCIDSTHADLNGNHVSSFSEFGNAVMGAAFNGPGSPVPVFAMSQSSFFTSWYCVVCDGGPVGQSVNQFAPVRVLLSISGRAANITDASFVELMARLTLTNGTDLIFDYAQDGASAPEARLDLGQGSIPVTLTQDLVTGDWSFSISAAVSTIVCGPEFPCQPAHSACFSTDTCAGTPSFSDTQSITLQYDGNANPFFLDAADPFSIQLVSDDPNFQFASSDGQVTGAGAAAAADEPESLALMLEGVLAIVFWGRRTRTPLG